MYLRSVAVDLWPVCFMMTYSLTPFKDAWVTWPDRRLDLYNKKLLHKSGNAVPNPYTQIRSKETQFRRFLIFHYFYSAPAPVIVCEGKTDNIYLTEAIKRLAVNYPSLASVSPTNVVSPRVKIFRYPDTSTGRSSRVNWRHGRIEAISSASTGTT